MEDKYKFSRTTILDKTTSIDEANLQKVNDISQLAQEQLKRFDQQLAKSEDPAAYYQRVREEMTSVTEVPTKETSSKNGVYELEVADTQMLPTITQKQEEKENTVKLNINLRGKLIIAVYTSIILLLGILMIYNAVSIANYNSQIANTNQQIVIKQQELDALQIQLQDLMQQINPQAAGMTQGGGTSLQAKEFAKNTVIKNQKEGNWFDDLCNFFSSIFGG